MTPEQLQALVAIATILKTVGTLPFGVVLLVLLIGPWAGMVIASGSIARNTSQSSDRAASAIAAQNERFNEAIAAQNERIDQSSREFRDHVTVLVASQEKRFEAVVRMYENNVQVVKDYHSLAADLTGIITLSTRTLEGLVQKIDNNQFCPLARQGVGKGGRVTA